MEIKPNVSKDKLFKLVKLLKEKKQYISDERQYHNLCVIRNYLSRVIDNIDNVIDSEVKALGRLKDECVLDSDMVSS